MQLYALLDTGYVSRSRWTAVAEALVEGEVDVLQVRAKKETPAERRELLEELLPVLERGRFPLGRVVINDDVALAQAYSEIGLHVGQDDADPKLARELLGPRRLIGLSTHSLDQAKAALALPAGTLSYFAVGPVYATQTKPGYTPVGLGLLSKVAALQPVLPWFAIGGVNRRSLPEVLAAGARRVVIVSDFLIAADPAAAVREAKRQLRDAPQPA